MIARDRRRRDASLAGLRREIPGSVRWSEPEGGLFVWVEQPAGVDADALLCRAAERAVPFPPGSSVDPAAGAVPRHELRLNFSTLDEERIAEEVRHLAGSLAQPPGTASSNRAPPPGCYR